MGYDISPLSRIKLKILTTRLEKYRNPWVTEGESIYPLDKSSITEGHCITQDNIEKL